MRQKLKTQTRDGYQATPSDFATIAALGATKLWKTYWENKRIAACFFTSFNRLEKQAAGKGISSAKAEK